MERRFGVICRSSIAVTYLVPNGMSARVVCKSSIAVTYLALRGMSARIVYKPSIAVRSG